MKSSSTLKRLCLGVVLVGSVYVCYHIYAPKETLGSRQESGVSEPATNRTASVTPPANEPDPVPPAVEPVASIVNNSPRAAPAEDSPAVQDAWKIGENAMRQISALQEAKLQRTAA